jgi:hypothetical protein
MKKSKVAVVLDARRQRWSSLDEGEASSYICALRLGNHGRPPPALLHLALNEIELTRKHKSRTQVTRHRRRRRWGRATRRRRHPRASCASSTPSSAPWRASTSSPIFSSSPPSPSCAQALLPAAAAARLPCAAAPARARLHQHVHPLARLRSSQNVASPPHVHPPLPLDCAAWGETSGWCKARPAAKAGATTSTSPAPVTPR